MLAWKLRITVLWTFIAVCQSAVMSLVLLEPGVLRDLMAGAWPGANARSAGGDIWLASSWLVPMAMAYLTLALKDAVSRWTSALVGAGYVVSSISVLIAVFVGTYGGGVRLVVLVASLVALLIVWHAWKWPHTSEITPPQQRNETTRL